MPITEADLPKIETEDASSCPATRSSSSAARSPRPKRSKTFTEKGDQYKVELIRDLEDGTISFYTNGAFTDLCRGPHMPNTGLHQGHQADLGGRSLLARQREEQDADAHLRHLVPQEVDARRVSRDDGGGQETRPPQAGQGPRAVLLLAARGPGSAPVAAQRRRAARPAGTVPARRAEGVRLPAGHHARTSATRSCT